MPIQRLDHINFVTQDFTATEKFYCEVIGLINGPSISTSKDSKWLYLYIEGQDFPILHIGDATAPKKFVDFERLAEVDHDNVGNFATGPLDHVCLKFDYKDYDEMINRLIQHQIQYQTFCQPNGSLKQIWVLDPNGIRIEMNFAI